MTRPRVHATRGDVDAEMAGALGLPITAVCGRRWVPTLFGADWGLPHCPICFPAVEEKKPRGADLARPHYVYRFYDSAGRLIYVGCTNNPGKRISEHTKKAWWRKEIATTRVIVFPNRGYALQKEREAIATEMPRCNVKGRWPYRTDAWTADDYVELRTAIVSAIESTHHVYGTNTTALLAEIDAELNSRFGVTAIARRPA